MWEGSNTRTNKKSRKKPVNWQDIRLTVLVVYEEKRKLRIQDSDDITINKRLGATITIRDDIKVTVATIDKIRLN